MRGLLHRDQLHHPLFRVRPPVAPRNETGEDVPAWLEARGEERFLARRNGGGLAERQHPRRNDPLRVVHVEEFAQRVIGRQFEQRHGVQVLPHVHQIEGDDAVVDRGRAFECVVGAFHERIFDFRGGRPWLAAKWCEQRRQSEGDETEGDLPVAVAHRG
ncbi:MAG: hypothetical protein ACK55I_28290, partial [bacterium]